MAWISCSHSFRRLHSIDTDSFFQWPQIISADHQSYPDSLDCLLTAYNTMALSLHFLINMLLSLLKSPIVIKYKSNTWFFHPLRAFRTTLRHAESIYKRIHSALDWSKFKFLRNRYHHLTLDAEAIFLLTTLFIIWQSSASLANCQ